MTTAEISVWKVLGRIALFVLAFAFASALTIVPVFTALSDWADANPMPARLYSDVAGALAILVATWVMTRFVDKRPFRSIGFSPQAAVRDLSNGLSIGAGWLAVSVCIAFIFGWATPQSPGAISGYLIVPGAVSTALNVLMQELILCGYILQTLRRRTGWPAAIVLSALLFSALHAPGFQGAWLPPVNVFAAGVLFCAAYAMTGNLWFPIAMHFAWNFLMGPVLGLTVSGTGETGLGWTVISIEGPALFTGGGFGLEGGLIVTCTTVGLLIVLLVVHARQGDTA